MAQLDIRLRVASPGLLSLPWRDPLADWPATEVPLRDIPVGPSRHLVRFVETDGHLWALKQLPTRLAAKEYEVLRALETKSLAAVRPAGLVIQPFEDTAILVTRFLERSWQYRRLLMRIPLDRPRHRERLLDAMASLLVDLHRNGMFWGDCSLANTLFSRDGQVLQAYLVDAETSELHPDLSDGQRQLDLDIMVENVAGGMMDLAMRLDHDPSIFPDLIEEARGIADRYQALWDVLHAEPTFSFADRYQVEGQIRQLQDLGFVVDEVDLQPAGTSDESLRLKVVVGGRLFHATQLRELTGIEVGEGQARVLIGDLRAYHHHLQNQTTEEVTEKEAARRWVADVFRPGVAPAYEALDRRGDPVQAYCDLLEVRWLLSEKAGKDVGNVAALEALSRRSVPPDSAARMAVAEEITGAVPTLTPALLDALTPLERE